MRARTILPIGVTTILAVALGALPVVAQPTATSPPDAWPREIQLSNATATMYQPQVDKWELNRLDFHAAVALKPKGADGETFGVIWGTTVTQVDRVARFVTLGTVTLTKSNFPTLQDQGALVLSDLRKQLPAATRTIALDRIEASLAASGAVKPQRFAVKNDPPRIIISYSPAMLVAINGEPTWRAVKDKRFERLINTRLLVLRSKRGHTNYLHVYDGWLSADTLDGTWSREPGPPRGVDAIARELAKNGDVDLVDGGATKPKPSLDSGVPTIYVSQQPAELIVFKGYPDLQSINGTALFWAANTTADVIVNGATNAYYVLVSGRWNTAPSIDQPWRYIPSTSLPGDFLLIPPSSPAAVVLASVAGTPQAQEAVIADSIPQTATVPRGKAANFSASFDGPPQLRPIDGTPLQYVVNAPTPIVRVDAQTYYAASDGVWYVAPALTAPWSVATSVPDVIYTIPPSSPLHFVTYVRVYGSTPTVVYEGYTPGYLGTVVAADGVVVYGTGYDYEPWLGTTWYARPVTYGLQAQPVYNPAVGWTYGFAVGATTAAVVDSYGAAAAYRPTYTAYACCDSASGNIYREYGDTFGSATASGVAQQGYERTVTTPAGGSASVSRGERYNAATGTFTTAASLTATGRGGREVTVEGGTASNAYGDREGAGVERTVTNPNTGVTRSTDTVAAAGPEGAGAEREATVSNTNTGEAMAFYDGGWHARNNVYAGNDGNVYRRADAGWQQRTETGWRDTSVDDRAWQTREEEARVGAETRYRSYYQGGWANRPRGIAGGAERARFGGGGWRR